MWDKVEQLGSTGFNSRTENKAGQGKLGRG